MEYIINSTRQEDEVVITNTTITFDSGDTITIDIAHYLPQSISEIQQNILNRITSEQTKINALKSINDLINQIPTNQTITI